MTNDPAQDRRCRIIAETIGSAKESQDHRKHRRWINRVVRMTRISIKRRGQIATTIELHRKQMRKLYNARWIPGSRP